MTCIYQLCCVLCKSDWCSNESPLTSNSCNKRGVYLVMRRAVSTTYSFFQQNCRMLSIQAWKTHGRIYLQRKLALKWQVPILFVSVHRNEDLLDFQSSDVIWRRRRWCVCVLSSPDYPMRHRAHLCSSLQQPAMLPIINTTQMTCKCTRV